MNVMGMRLRRKLSESTAVKSIWAGTTWKTVAEVAGAAHVSVGEVNSWIAQERIFAVDRDGVALLPDYAFGPEGIPLESIARVVTILRPIYSEMAIAAFFESPSKTLDGLRPRVIIRAEPDRVVAAAQFDIDTVKFP